MFGKKKQDKAGEKEGFANFIMAVNRISRSKEKQMK
jgi:hypothetical protein